VDLIFEFQYPLHHQKVILFFSAPQEKIRS
jgi:hypothetical protein